VDRGDLDLYQLTSYLSGHDVPLGALAYPRHETDQAAVDQHGPWVTREGQRAVFARLPATASDTTQATHRPSTFRSGCAIPCQREIFGSSDRSGESR
jgi:hypothetical protein